MKIDTLDHALQLKNKHIIVQTIHWNDRNNDIKISASNIHSSWPYYLLYWLVIVLEMNKVTRKIKLTMVVLPFFDSVKIPIHLTLFWCLALVVFVTNNPYFRLCKLTHYIAHSSSITITYLCKELNKMLSTKISKYQPPRTTVTGLITCSTDWLQFRKRIR